MHYINVILPLKLNWEPLYRVNGHAERGSWVRVEFAHREYLAVVDGSGDPGKLTDDRIGDVLHIEESYPAVSLAELEFWHFISDYYLCSIGEVFKAAYPTARIKGMERAKSAVEKRKLRMTAEKENLLESIRNCSDRIHAKQELLLQKKEGSASRNKLEADIAKLESKISKDRSRLDEINIGLKEKEASTTGISQDTTKSKSTVLVLNGPDRLETYIREARQCIESGRQVLLLAPTVADSAAISRAFPESTLINSLSSESARRLAEEEARSGKARAFIGTRIAIWLPFRDLGLIVVEREHDTFYKQSEPSPRFNCRDSAIALSCMHGARVILGSASPSFETLYNLFSGKYAAYPESKVITQEYPTIIDISKLKRQRGMKGSFSLPMIDMIREEASSVAIVRGWENMEQLSAEISALFPGKSGLDILSYSELRQKGTENYGMIAVLQADALVANDDFRADERAGQIISELRESGCKVVVQTSVPDRFDGSRGIATLMKERQRFGLPPYTRLMDIIIKDSDSIRLNKASGFMIQMCGAVPIGQEADRATLRVTLKRSSEANAKKAEILSQIRQYERQNRYPGHIIVDVDPQ